METVDHIETIDSVKSPFQLFSAFTEKDMHKFFGREKETSLLFQYAQEANVVLVYGESGTGKTSIVQCGLLNETKHFKWTSILVRRGEDINNSLVQELQNHADSSVIQEGDTDVVHLMQEVFLNSFQPILLVFDQFEEIFVFGTQKERNTFLDKISIILDLRIPWKMIFVIREDFLAQLDDFEKELPGLFKKRLRIELMDQSNCRQVIIRSCEVFNVNLAPVRKNEKGNTDFNYNPSLPDTPDEIINAVSDNHQSVHLPYLQVFLDRLWREAWANNSNSISIDQQLVQKVGKIENVLKTFLEEKVNGQSIITSVDAWKVLKLFVPEKGTTRKKVKLSEYTAIDTIKLHEIVTYFRDYKILSGCSDQFYELAHESLVPVIQCVKLNQIRPRLKKPTISNPYKGLLSFDEEDQNKFYGRKEAINTVYEKIRQNDFIVIVGNSGAGKSSLVKAGLIPRLEKEDGYQMLPPVRAGATPVNSLQLALKQAESDPVNKKFLLLIDQYEELITRIAGKETRDAVYQKIYEVLENQKKGNSPFVIKFIVTVRADFEPQFRIAEPLSDYWKTGKYIIPPFTREEIREVIEEPAYQAGLEFSPPSLVEKITEEVYSSQATGLLPLMSFTLKELYDRYITSGRNDNLLREEDYIDLGGVIGGLQNRAEQMYHRFKEEYPNNYGKYQGMMQNIILRMIYLSTGELAGQRVFADDLVFPDDQRNNIKDQVLKKLLESHLVVTGDDRIKKAYYEPAHDVLVRSWGQIWDWINQVGKEKLFLRGRLTQAVNDYFNSNKEKQLLWDNKWLDELVGEVKDENTWLNKKEFDFVTAGIKKREEAAAIIQCNKEEKDRQQKEKDEYKEQLIAEQKYRIKRTRRFAIVSLSLLTIAVVLGLWVWQKSKEANKNLMLAIKNRNDALQNRLELTSTINTKNKILNDSLKQWNVLLAAQIDSVNTAWIFAEKAAKNERIQREKANLLIDTLHAEISNRQKAEFALRQSAIELNSKIDEVNRANEKLKTTIDALQVQKDQNLTQLTNISKSFESTNPVKAYRVAQLAFNKDSLNKEVAQQYNELAQLRTYYYTREFAGDYSFISPDGQYVLSTSAKTQSLTLRQNETYALVDSIYVPGLISAAFSRSSRQIMLLYNNKVEICRPTNLHDKNKFTINGRDIAAACFSSDESRMLVATGNQLQVWPILSNNETTKPFTIKTPAKIIFALFSEDNKRIVSGSINADINVWDAANGKPIDQPPHKNIYRFYLSPTGNCYIIGTPGSVYVYNSYGKLIYTNDFVAKYGQFNSAIFSEDGQQVLLTFNLASSRLAPNEQQTQKGDYPNKYSAVVLNINTSRLNDITSLLQQEDIALIAGISTTVTFKDNLLLYGLDHGTVKLIRLNNGDKETLAGNNSQVTSISVYNGGKNILTSTENNITRVWQFGTAQTLDHLNILPVLSNEELIKYGINKN